MNVRFLHIFFLTGIALCSCSALPDAGEEAGTPAVKEITLSLGDGGASRTITTGETISAHGLYVYAYRSNGSNLFMQQLFTDDGTGTFRGGRYWPAGAGTYELRCVYPGYWIYHVNGVASIHAGEDSWNYNCYNDLVVGSAFGVGPLSGDISVTLEHPLCGLGGITVRLDEAPVSGTTCYLDTLCLTVPHHGVYTLPSANAPGSWSVDSSTWDILWTGHLSVPVSGKLVDLFTERFLLPAQSYAMHLAWSWSGGATGSADVILDDLSVGVLSDVTVTLPENGVFGVTVSISGYESLTDLGTVTL